MCPVRLHSHRTLSGGTLCSVSGVRWNYSRPPKENPLFVKAPFIVTPHFFAVSKSGTRRFI